MVKKFKKLFMLLRVKKYLRTLIVHGVAAGVEHSKILSTIEAKKIKTIIDIGGNRGQFSLVSRQIFPDSKIIAFEPLHEPAKIYKTVFSSDQKVTLHEIAIGPEENQSIIHVSNADDSSSLFPISSLQTTLYKGTFEKETRNVNVKPLNSVLETRDIQQPALLKMDVQGFEKEALLGCKKLLHLFSFIYIECSFVELYIGQSLAHEIISFLYEGGYVLNGIYNMSYDKKGLAIQGDFLFTRKNITNL